MIAPLQLSLEEITKLTPNASDVYYRKGARFLTTKKDLLEKCKLNDNQKATVHSFSDKGFITMITVEMGMFNIDL